MNKKNLSRFAVLAVLAVGAVTMVLLSSFRAEAEKKQVPLTIRTVKTAALVAAPQTVWIQSDGFLKPGRQLEIQSPIAGRVAFSLGNLKGGITVNEGDILLVLDDRRARLAFESARTEMLHTTVQFLTMANLDDSTRTAWGRYVQNLESAQPDTLPDWPRSDQRQDLLAVTKGVVSAGYRLESAAMDLNDHFIKAPFGGIISGESILVDSWVAPGYTLATLVEINPMELTLSLSEEDLTDLDGENPVTISRPGDGKSVLGTLSRIEPLLNSGSQTARIHISVDVSGEEGWLPGSFVKARMKGRVYENALRIPREILVGDRVPLYVEGKLVLKKVTILARDGSDFILAPDLDPGSEYVVTILQNPLEGMLLQKEEVK